MNAKKTELLIIAGIFLCALLLRVYALSYLPQRPITDDAFEYHYIARHLGTALKNGQLDDQARFLYLGAKRGWLYPLFLATLYKVCGPGDLSVRVFQAIIDALTCLLVYGIGRNIFGRSTGSIAASLCAFYPGLIYYSTILYQETTTIFLITLYIFCLQRAISKKKSFFYVIAGILVIIITFYRSGFIFFSLLTIPTLLITLRAYYKKNFVRCFGYFLLGSIFMFITYAAFSYTVGKTLILNKPSIAWSIYETIHRDGWVADTFSPTPTEELNEIAKDYTSSLPSDDQLRKLPPKAYIKAGILLIYRQPLHYISQLLKRISRMWWFLETYPGRWHSTGVWVQLCFHRCLLILGLVGIPLSFTLWYYCWPFYFIFAYVTSVYIPTIGIPRYAIIAMPSLILLAAYALIFILGALSHMIKRSLSLKLLLPFIAATLTVFMVYYLDVATFLTLFPHISPGLSHIITIFVMNLLCAVIAFWAYRLFTIRGLSTRHALSVIAFPLFAVITIYNNAALTSKTWHEWEAPLYSTEQKIKQVIVLPEDFNFGDYTEAHLVIDMFPGGGDDYNFHVKINGAPIKDYRGGIKAKGDKFDDRFFGLYKSFFFNTYKLTPEELRQWYEIELPLHLFRNRAQLMIECFLSGTTDRTINYVIVFGDYITSDKNLFEGPCIPMSELDTSLTKIMPYSGDYRFERITPLSSRKTMSAYRVGSEWQSTDLSSVRGIQSGNYRIRLELIGMDGRQTIL